MPALIRSPGPVRRFLLASLQSSVGNAIGYVALLLLAYERLHSPWAISLVLLADFLPAIVLAPIAFCTAFVAGGLIASLGDARAVFAASGAGALLVATLAAVMLRHTRMTAAAA